MICFHFLYDLNFFGIINISLYTGVFFYLAYGTASLFILLFGLSLTLKYQQMQSMSTTSKTIPLYFIYRGMKIFFLGLIITIVTYVLIPDRFIIFGILHFIGMALLICYPFLKMVKENIVLGVLIIIFGWVIRQTGVDFSWGLAFGFIPYGFSTVDYFPLFPWFGVALLGIALGNMIYKNGKRQFHLSKKWSQCPIPLFCFLGRNSLIIYFFHQPILFGMIYILLA